MKILNESNINRIMSHMKDKDIAMLTAFRTDPKIGLSKKQNRERNKNLENKLSSMGYRGFTKIVGYYNETPEDKDSDAVAEESYIILNTGSSFEDFVTDMTLLSKDFNQQSIVIWSHANQKAYLLDNQGNILQTFADFSIDTVSKGWSDIKGHNLTFIEESVDIRFGFTDKFNENGNWMTAMGYDAAKNKYRKEDNNMNEDLIKELNNIPESNEVDTAVPVTLAAAKEDDKENVESVKKSFKDLDKFTAEFIKQNDNRENKVKGTEAMDKMELMESLFEDYDEKECEKVKDEVLEILCDNGYDVDSEDVQNYAWAAADYICMTRDYGEEYSVEQWFEDTSDNYPEDLEELPMMEGLSTFSKEDIESIKEVLEDAEIRGWEKVHIFNDGEVIAVDFKNRPQQYFEIGAGRAFPLDKEELPEEMVDMGSFTSKGSLGEAKENKPGMIGYVLEKYADDLAKLTSAQEAIDFLNKHEEEIQDKKYLEEVKRNLAKKKGVAALAYLYNIILKGEDKGRNKEESLTEGKEEDKLKKEFESRDLWQEVYDAVTKNLSTNETSAKKFSKVRKHQADYSDIRVDRDFNIIIPYRSDEARKYLESVADDYVLEIKEDKPLKDSQGEDVKTVKIFAGELV